MATFNGGNGNDVFIGGIANDILNGGNGNDTLSGGNGNDTISGGNGQDVLNGDAGNDNLDGGNGEDWLSGGTGNDKLSGGNGDDILDGGAGNDIVNGDNGNDIFDYNVTDNLGSKDVFDGGNGTDTLRISVTNAQFSSAAFQADLTAFNAWLANHTKNSSFHFNSFDLTVKNFEQVQIVNLTPANAAPAGADNTVTLNEDSTYVFGVADFGFSDTDGDAFAGVKISTLPGAGSLKNDGVTVGAGSPVSAADIAAGKLVFTPAANGNGSSYASFTFQVQDDGGTAGGGIDLDQSPNTMTMNVEAVNDAPDVTITSAPATLIEATADDSGVASVTAQLLKSDIDGGAILHYDSTLMISQGWTLTSGTTLSKVGTYGTAVLTFDNSGTDAASLTYTLDNAAADALAAGQQVIETFTVSASDGELVGSTDVAFTIEGRNDAPVVSLGSTNLIVNGSFEDLPYLQPPVGWTAGGGNPDPGLFVNVLPTHDGIVAADLGPAGGGPGNNGGWIEQTIPDLVPGSYTLSFWYASEYYLSSTAHFLFELSGAVTLTETLVGGTSYQNYLLTFDVSSSDDLTIRFTDTAADINAILDDFHLVANVTPATFSENGASVDIVGAAFSVSDVDDTNLESATVVLTNAQDGDALQAGSLPFGISAAIETSTPGIITVTLTGSASVADYRNAIQAITFSNSSDNPSGIDRIINITVDDGSDASDTVATTLQVVPVNDAPIIRVGGIPDLAFSTVSSGDASVVIGDGTGAFGSPIAVPTGSGQIDVALADLDGDGDNELITTNTDSTVRVQLNNGDGIFTAGAIAGMPGAGRIATGDVNGDGKLDVVTSNFFDVGVLLGDGAGGFSSAITVPMVPGGGIPAGVSVVGVNLGDVDNDGDLDIITANYEGGVSVLVGDGTGNFEADTPMAAGSRVIQAVVADLNGDNNLDIITANQVSRDVVILYGDGAGGFTAAAPIVPGSDPFSVAIGDVDHDGDMDIAVGQLVNLDPAQNYVRILLGDGSGGFALGDAIQIDDGPSGVRFSDFNSDGNLDIVTGNGFNPTSTILIGNGAGNFAIGQTITIPGGFFGFAVGDVDGGQVVDEDDALVFGGTNQNKITLSDVDAGSGDETVTLAVLHGILTLATTAGLSVSGDGTGSVSLTGTVAAINAALDGLTYAPTADYNGDDELTITANDNGNSGSGGALTATRVVPIVVNPVDEPVPNVAPVISLQSPLDYVVMHHFGTIGVASGNGDGTFSAIAIHGSGGFGTSHAALADVDGDGDTDIVTANNFTKDLAVLLSDGSGGFSASGTYSSGGDIPFSVDIGDINGDGYGDAVVSNVGTNSVGVLLGDGSGAFGTATTYASGGLGPYWTKFGDVNGDAKLDVLVSNSGGDIGVLLGNGDGTFGATTVVATPGIAAFGLAIGDLDGDDDQDVAVTDYNGSQIGVLLGNGDGTFAGPVSYDSGGVRPYAVVFGDIDEDGDLDAVTANQNSNSVGVLLGNGDGTFGSTQVHFTSGSAVGVQLGDYDSDGDLDILALIYGQDSVALFSGDGSGGFAAPNYFAAGNGNNYAIVVGDLLPGGNSYSVDEDDALVFGGTNQNKITLSDVDAGSGDETVTLAVLHGILSLATTAGLSVSGDGTSSVSLTGTVAAINAALDGLTYAPNADYNGDDALTITANDNGNSGAGGALTATRVVPIVVNPVDEPDTTPPSVVSFVATDALNTNTGTVHYLLTLSEAVTGVAASQFALSSTGLTGAAIVDVSVVAGSGDTQYALAVDTGSGDGTLFVDFIGHDVHDLAGNPLEVEGGFDTFASYWVSGRPRAHTSGDFNGDGHTDIVTANFDYARVSVLLGNGDGTFQPETLYFTGGFPGIDCIGAADMNKDGYLDVVTYGSAEICVLLGNGDGTLQSPISQSSLSFTIAIGDVDNDDNLDVVGANGVASVSVLLGNGDGTLQTSSIQPVGPGGPSYVNYATLGDLDADGNLDLVTTDVFYFTASVSKGNGDGTFQAPTLYAIGGAPDPVGANGPWQATIGDVNADGSLDILTANFKDKSVSVLLGNGDGTFQNQVQYAVGNHAVDVAIGEFDGDGFADLAVTDAAGASVTVLRGNGDGTFQSPIHYGTAGAPYSVTTDDLNHDGLDDLVTANYSSNETGLSVLINGPAPGHGATYVVDDLTV